MASVELGLPGVALLPGDHVCAFYAGQDTVGEAMGSGRFTFARGVGDMTTHPKLLVGGMVLDNPYYLTADELLARRQ